MIIYFENQISKKKQDIVMNAINLACKELLPRIRNLNISIITSRNLFKKYGVCGDCMWEDGRDFTIRLDNSINIDELITTILHEMVHVKQYVRNEYFNYDLPYNERPHEIEAHTLERSLKGKYDAIYTK